jgi:hypothetical protein
MAILTVALAWLSLLLLAAHVMRAGSVLLVVGCLAVMVLVPMQRAWAVWSVQVVLWLATVEWLRTAWVLMGVREAADRPWLRMVLILGAVALLSGVAAWLHGSAARSDLV